jgi:hypothetical protein
MALFVGTKSTNTFVMIISENQQIYELMKLLKLIKNKSGPGEEVRKALK